MLAGSRYAEIQRAFAEVRAVSEKLRITTLADLESLLDEQVWAVDLSPEAVALMPANLRTALQRRMKTINAQVEASAMATRVEAMAVDAERTRMSNAVATIRDADVEAARIALEAARYQRLSEEIARLAQGVSVPPAPPALPQIAEQPWPNLVEQFFIDRPSISDQASHRQAFREFEGLVGPKPIREVTKTDIKAFADFLRDRPINRAGRETMSRRSIVKLLSHLKGLFGWAFASGIISNNPAEGVQPRTETRDERIGPAPRRAFTKAELTVLFDSPMFTGCKTRSRPWTPGSNVYRDEPYWFFLIALLTGARIEEIAALPSAFVDLDGVACFDFRHATKTGAGPRLIPVLPELRRLGIERWAAEQAKRGRGMVEGPNASDDWSRWTNRYLDRIGLGDPAIVTYSLRHNFRQQLRAAKLDKELMNKVFGHEGDAVGDGYGRDLAPDEARLVVESVKAPINLAHLHIFL